MIKLIAEQVKKIGIGTREKIIDLDTYYEFAYTPKEDQFDIAVSSDGAELYVAEINPGNVWRFESGEFFLSIFMTIAKNILRLQMRNSFSSFL